MECVCILDYGQSIFYMAGWNDKVIYPVGY